MRTRFSSTELDLDSLRSSVPRTFEVMPVTRERTLVMQAHKNRRQTNSDIRTLPSTLDIRNCLRYAHPAEAKPEAYGPEAMRQRG